MAKAAPRFAWTRHPNGDWTAHGYRIRRSPLAGHGWQVCRGNDYITFIPTLNPAKRWCEADRSRQLATNPR
jgi:hypothetical protein